MTGTENKQRFVLLAVALTLFWLLSTAGTLKASEKPRFSSGRQREWAPIDRYDEASAEKATTNTNTNTPPRPPRKLKTRTPTAAPQSEDGLTESDEDGGEREAREGSEDVDSNVAKKEDAEVPFFEKLIRAEPVDFSDETMLENCPHTFKDTDQNINFVLKFRKIFAKLKVHWWLDEGGLIGASRAGGMTNADDDFDFFALLPNQIHPCREDSYDCTKEEYNKMIHGFLMEFWNEGMCINNFDPDYSKFDSKSKLMYSLMMDRKKIYQPNAATPGARCFEHGKTPHFAHMHLGMLTEDGKLATNKWAKGKNEGGHPQDKMPVEVVLPVTRCRTGRVEAPCPHNVSQFLKLRNEGEYAKTSSQGNCLIIRKKWGDDKKNQIIQLTRNLHECGYNSMYDLIEPAIASNYMTC